MPLNYLKDLGPELIDKGYEIVPIKPGYKYPKGLKNWQSIKATHGDVTRWSSNGFTGGGVGAICGKLVGVDLDILDEEISERVIAWCEKHLGSAPQRIGLAPKTLLVFRTETPFSKIISNSYTDFFDDIHRIEILGQGQQFVAYAKHPDTDKPYKWVNGPGLSDIEFNDLPEISEQQVRDLISYFEKIAPTQWTLKTGGQMGGVADTEPFDPIANFQPKVQMSNDEIHSVLDKVRYIADEPGQYDEWRAVGMALHHQYNGSDEGLGIWDEWSAGGYEYNEKDIKAKWRSFGKHRGSDLTFAYVIKLKNERQRLKKPAVKTLDNTNGYKTAAPFKSIDFDNDKEYETYMGEFLDRYIFVESGNEVCDLVKPPQFCLSKLEEFRNMTANKRHEIPAPTQAEPDRVKISPVHNTWLVHPDRLSAQSELYSPREGRVYFDKHDLCFINTFYMPEFDASDTGSIDVFLEHMDYLIPSETEREWFIDWIAFNIQHPELRCKVTPLHVSVAHGTGRGWVVELLHALLGAWNCTKTKMADLCGEGSAGAYQEYLDKSLMCFVEEVKESSKRYSISDKIRSTLTDSTLNINVKFGAKTSKEVFTNFFFMSNHTDALVLTIEDRRIYVLTGPKAARDMPYYDRLYEWLRPENIYALSAWLRDRDLSKFDWKRCADTPGRMHMIDNNRTLTETAFWDFINSKSPTAATHRDVCANIQTFMEGGSFEHGVDDRQVLKLLQQHCEQHTKMKFQGKTVRPWLIGDWPVKSNERVRECLENNT